MSETPVAHQPGEQPVLVQRATLMAAAPADWFFKEQITFLAPDGQANVIASTEPLDPSIDVGGGPHRRSRVTCSGTSSRAFGR